MSDSLQPHESQHTRPPCPSPTPGVHPNSHPSSQWCHPAISSSVVPFSSCPQSLPASQSFPVSQLFASGGQSTGVSALASFLPKKSRADQNHSSKASILRHSAFFTVQLTHLEPGILECEVKWALESITTNKASGSDGIPVELFQILKDDSVKVLHSISQQIWKTQQWPQDWKRSVFIPIPKKSNAKECSNYCTIALISHASKVMLQARLQQYVNHELPDVQVGFRKGRGTRDQIANIR